MTQNEPNFWVGLKSDLVPLGCPRIGPEVQRTTATSGFLELAGCEPWMSQIANQCAVTSSVYLVSSSLQRPSNRLYFTASISSLGHAGAGLQWDWEMWPSHL